MHLHGDLGYEITAIEHTEPEKMACSCLGPSLVAKHFFGPGIGDNEPYNHT